MAETKTHEHRVEREYVIPLRKEWTKVPNYKRTSKSITAIKEFVAKHMKVPGRDLNNVKIDSYLNNEVWFRGAGTPPARIKVKVIKTGDIIHVTFVQDPERVKFARERHARKHVKTEKKVNVSDKKEEAKTEDEKKIESEKEKSTAIANEQIAEQKVKEQKHVAKDAMAHTKAPVQRRRTIASN
jgi:ribosomal protein L31E